MKTKSKMQFYGSEKCSECNGKGWTRAYTRNEYEVDECPVCKGRSIVAIMKIEKVDE